MSRSRNPWIFPLGGLVAVGLGAYLALTSRPALPTAAWLETYPLPALALTGVAGFSDGINPCAITTLLLFVGALLAVVERSSNLEDMRQAKRYVWAVAGAYILGIFLLYFLLGVGFIEISGLQLLGNTHLFTRLAGLSAILLGLIMAAEYFYPNSPLKLGMPTGLHRLAHKWGRKTSLGGAFMGGVLIGTCTIPCGGAMYLAVAALIGSLPSKAYGYTLLTWYNLAFVLPLVLLVAVGSSRAVLQKVSRLHVTHRGQVKLGLGLFVIAVGFFALV